MAYIGQATCEHCNGRGEVAAVGIMRSQADRGGYVTTTCEECGGYGEHGVYDDRVVEAEEVVTTTVTTGRVVIIPASQPVSGTRLLDRALAAGMTAEADYIELDRYMVRDPARPGYVQLTGTDFCTCSEFAWIERCPHVALVNHIEATSGAAMTEAA